MFVLGRKVNGIETKEGTAGPGVHTIQGLDALPLQVRAVVTGLTPATDPHSHSVLLRLLEIGFVPGEVVRIMASAGRGGDPIAVRVGQATFALRRHEAAMVQVQRKQPAQAAPRLGGAR